MKKHEVINLILLEMDQEGGHWQALGETARQLEADRRWQVQRAGIVPGDPLSVSPADLVAEIERYGTPLAYSVPPWIGNQKTRIPADQLPSWQWNGNSLTRAELVGLRDLLRAKGEPAAEPATAVPGAELIIVPLEMITPNPAQPRRDFDQEQLEGLANSILENGLLQFPTVEPIEDGYQLIDGERRWRACALAGLDSMPVIVRPALDDQQRLLLAVESNEQRANLNPVELAQALQLLADGGMSNAQIGRSLGGLSASTISNKRRLLELPDHVLAMVEAGQLTERQAAALLPLYSLPPAVLEKTNTSWQSPAKILDHAAAGATSNQVRDMVHRLILGVSGSINDDVIQVAGSGVEAANCLDCPRHFYYKTELRCTNYECRQLKERLQEQQLLAPAVAATGIAALSDERGYYSFDGIYDDDMPNLLATIADCPNRRLAYNIPTDNSPNRVAPAGLDNICKIVCIAGYNDCSCAATVRGMAKPEPEPEPEPTPWQYRLSPGYPGHSRARVRVTSPGGKWLELERDQVAAAVAALWGEATAALLQSPERALLAEARARLLATADRLNAPGQALLAWYEDGEDAPAWDAMTTAVRDIPQAIVADALRELVQELPDEQLRAELEEA